MESGKDPLEPKGYQFPGTVDVLSFNRLPFRDFPAKLSVKFDQIRGLFVGFHARFATASFIVSFDSVSRISHNLSG